jgi:glycosyltransferase involved in cell wall biosynthesis
MRIAYLAGQSSIHTIKWANEMSSRGHEVHLITMHSKSDDSLNKHVKLHILKIPQSFGYYLNYREAQKIIKTVKPDILNTHYASGYGTLSRLINFHPIVLSVWGSDVYEFPYRSYFSRRILQKNLAHADQIASTSYAMKAQTETFIKPQNSIAITPFGVDTNIFSPLKHETGKFTIGIVKKMDFMYGIDYLIRAFALLIERDFKDIELLLVGSGQHENEFKKLAKSLNVHNLCHFTGNVPNTEVPIWLNRMDVFCAPSICNESFGVAVVEASACGIPVIVSDAGGLPEVVINNVTGFIIPKKDHEAIAEAIIKLIENRELTEKFGKGGRNFVLQNYEWNENASRMEQLYEMVIKAFYAQKTDNFL